MDNANISHSKAGAESQPNEVSQTEKLDANHLEVDADRLLGHLANQEDHEIGVWQSLKKYPWACAWCVYACWTVILVSFENQASSSVLGIPEFRKDFGSYFEGNYVLPAEWQSAFSAAPVASAIFGVLGGAALADIIGRKLALMIALVVSFAAIAVEFVAVTNPVFFGGKFLNGFAVGTIQAVMTTYIGEVCRRVPHLSLPAVANSIPGHPSRLARNLHRQHWRGFRYRSSSGLHCGQLYWRCRLSLGLPHGHVLPIRLCSCFDPLGPFLARVCSTPSPRYTWSYVR